MLGRALHFPFLADLGSCSLGAYVINFLYVLPTYSMFSHPGWQDGTICRSLVLGRIHGRVTLIINSELFPLKFPQIPKNFLSNSLFPPSPAGRMEHFTLIHSILYPFHKYKLLFLLIQPKMRSVVHYNVSLVFPHVSCSCTFEIG